MSSASNSLLEGISFLTSNLGDRTSVLIDLEKYGEDLEDFFDIIESRARMEENNTTSVANFKAELRIEGRNIGTL